MPIKTEDPLDLYQSILSTKPTTSAVSSHIKFPFDSPKEYTLKTPSAHPASEHLPIIIVSSKPSDATTALIPTTLPQESMPDNNAPPLHPAAFNPTSSTTPFCIQTINVNEAEYHFTIPTNLFQTSHDGTTLTYSVIVPDKLTNLMKFNSQSRGLSATPREFSHLVDEDFHVTVVATDTENNHLVDFFTIEVVAKQNLIFHRHRQYANDRNRGRGIRKQVAVAMLR